LSPSITPEIAGKVPLRNVINLDQADARRAARPS
jgi:hypothetical protein